MNVACVIVGINQWEEYTLPLLESIKQHEPEAKRILVDNGSDPPYPFPTVRLETPVCYSAAINAGMDYLNGYGDWTIVLNNDVLCQGPFVETLEWMHPALYGNQLITFKDMRWLGLWLFAIHKDVWEVVGEFDEQFEVCGFDDADFCFRAASEGFEILKCNLPFKHMWGKTRWGVPGYEGTRKENLKRLEEKHGVSLAGEWQVFN